MTLEPWNRVTLPDKLSIVTTDGQLLFLKACLGLTMPYVPHKVPLYNEIAD